MGQRLLLVDSDRSFLKEHQVSLEAAFDLEVAKSPEGVATFLEMGDFAAVLICVEVADNKGYALCSTIRKQPALSGIKIALISAKATEEEYRRHQSLKGRADLYLHKPIAPSALVAALCSLGTRPQRGSRQPSGRPGGYGTGRRLARWLEGIGGRPASGAHTRPPGPPSSSCCCCTEIRSGHPAPRHHPCPPAGGAGGRPP